MLEVANFEIEQQRQIQANKNLRDEHATNCMPCLAGTFSNSTGQVHSCNGHCSLGKWSSETGLTSNGECLDCRAGTYGTERGAASSGLIYVISKTCIQVLISRYQFLHIDSSPRSNHYSIHLYYQKEDPKLHHMLVAARLPMDKCFQCWWINSLQ